MRRTVFRQLAHWIFAAATLFLAGSLIVKCVEIYHAGVSPDNLSAAGVRIRAIFSTEILREQLGFLPWALAIWLIALLSACLFGKNGDKNPYTSHRDARMQLKAVKEHVVPNADMLRIRRRRLSVFCVAAALCVGCAIICLAYLLNVQNFASRELEAVMGELLRRTAPCLITGMGFLIAAEVYADKSRMNELRAARHAPRRETKPQPKEGSSQTAVRTVLYVAAVSFIVLGILNGGLRDMLVKAINICTECIGLG